MVGIEWRKRREEFGNGHQAGVEGLISTQFVGTHFLTPETLSVQTDIPVGEVVVDEGVNESASAGRIEAVKFFLYAFDEGVQAGEDPAVNLRALFEGHL